MLRFILKSLSVLFLFGFAFLLGLILMDKLIMPKVVGHGETVITPDISERSLEEAEELLLESGLHLVRDSEVHDPVVPEGYVLSQKPRAYSKIKKGRRIHVVVSKGSELLTVPNITRGISLRTAEIELKSVGFELGSVTHQSSEDIPKGVVLSQSPSPNTVAPRGTFVNVTVSRGPKTGLTIVPELIGLSTESAVVELKEAGLTVGTIEHVKEADILPETVIRQSIEAGEEVDRGTLVDITVTE